MMIDSLVLGRVNRVLLHPPSFTAAPVADLEPTVALWDCGRGPEQGDRFIVGHPELILN
jgi:hypothetical protein